MQQRLIVFCNDVDLEVERVRRAVKDLRTEKPELAPLEIEEVEAPAILMDAGWTTLAIRAARGRGNQATDLDGYLEALVNAFARSLNEGVIGVYQDVANGYARACYQKGEGSAKRAEGDAGRVVKQTATWIHCDGPELARYFRDQQQQAAPAAAQEPPPLRATKAAKTPKAAEAPLTDGEPESGVEFVEAEPDDDDRFVESKLKAARELMEQYRSKQK